MRTTLILTSLLFLVACGSGEPSVTANTEPALSDTTLTSDPAESTEHDTLIELKEKNQITDYAEFFLQAPVFKDREKMDWNAGASATLSHQHYYEVLDIENGYAEVTGSYEGKHTFAIWRMANGNNL